MSMNLQFSGQLSQQQQLHLAPQLLQWLRLLQVPAQSLEQLVRGELDTNPALELDDVGVEGDLAACEESAVSELSSQSEEWPELEERFSVLAEIDTQWAEETSMPGVVDTATAQERRDYQMQSITGAETLSGALLAQIAVSAEADELKRHAASLVGMLDERGYLESTLAVVQEELDLSASAAQNALAFVQSLEPAGVGARDLSECLLLQLVGESDQITLARRVVSECLPALATGRVGGIAEHLGVTEAQVEDAWALIRSLDPAPGKSVGTAEVAHTVTPDIVISLNAKGNLKYLWWTILCLVCALAAMFAVWWSAVI